MLYHPNSDSVLHTVSPQIREYFCILYHPKSDSIFAFCIIPKSDCFAYCITPNLRVFLHTLSIPNLYFAYCIVQKQTVLCILYHPTSDSILHTVLSLIMLCLPDTVLAAVSFVGPDVSPATVLLVCGHVVCRS